MVTYFDEGDLLAPFFPAFFFLVLSFLIGSIPFRQILTRFFFSNKKDVFWPTGLLICILDALKGALAVLIAMPIGYRILLMTSGLNSEDSGIQYFEGALKHYGLGELLAWLAGFSCILGHCFSPWIHFKGGKGIATGFGVLCILSLPSSLVGLGTFVLTLLHKRIVSLASISSVLVASGVYLVLNPVGIHMWAGGAIILFILMKHEGQLDALINKSERPFA